MNTVTNYSFKKIIFVIASFFLIITSYNLYMANVVTLSSNMPKAVRPGATIPVTITIDKGNIDGFGRFTCTLPKDFVATSNNQNFSFSDNTVTFLWVKLPQSSTFSFDFNITVPDKTRPFTFSAKFGYVQDNEKRFAELTPVNVRVTNGADEIPLAQNETSVNESTGKADQLFEVGNLDGTDFEVTKTTETTTQVISSKEPDLINNILSPSATKPTMTTIDAEPGHITQTTTQTTTQVTTTTTTIKPIDNTAVKQETAQTATLQPKSEAPKLRPKTLSSTNRTATAQTTTTKPTLTNKANEVKTSTAKSNKVSFRVQVAASHKQIKNQQNFFAKRNITEKVDVEKIGNWYKYTMTNSFDKYVGARDFRNSIWEQTPIKGAFVVAYNGKQRITVQEALMLSNQKWVK